MPFTPFHLGPAVFFGLLSRKHIHVPTFIVASVILDVEPLFVLISGSGGSLHGYLHTLVVGLFTGVLLGLAMFALEKPLAPVYGALLLSSAEGQSPWRFMIAGSLGTALHILLDSPLYDDIRPLYPLSVNPFYSPAVTKDVYLFCIFTGASGIFLYAYVALKTVAIKVRKSWK